MGTPARPGSPGAAHAAEAGVGVADLEEHGAGDIEQLEQERAPAVGARVAEQRARGGRRIGERRAAAGEPLDQPRVERAGAQVAGAGERARVGHLVEEPAQLGRREVRIERQPGLVADARGERRIGGEPLDERLRAGVLPDERVVERPAGAPVPGQDGLALVGERDASPRRAPPAPSSTSPTARSTRRRISSASCSTQPGRGQIWRWAAYARPTIRPSASTRHASVPVVP